MIFDFKGKKVSNTLSVFNYYKRISGTPLEGDVLKLKKFIQVVDNPEATDDEIAQAYEKCNVEQITILLNIYYAMRCAAEKKELDFSEVTDELETTDLIDGSMEELIQRLVSIKKKEVATNRLRGFLTGKK